MPTPPSIINPPPSGGATPAAPGTVNPPVGGGAPTAPATISPPLVGLPAPAAPGAINPPLVGLPTPAAPGTVHPPIYPLPSGLGAGIIDDLSSTSAADALSANQGRVLKGLATEIRARTTGVITLSDTSTAGETNWAKLVDLAGNTLYVDASSVGKTFSVMGPGYIYDVVNLYWYLEIPDGEIWSFEFISDGSGGTIPIYTSGNTASKTGNQTFTGINAFSQTLTVAAATAAGHAMRKDQVEASYYKFLKYVRTAPVGSSTVSFTPAESGIDGFATYSDLFLKIQALIVNPSAIGVRVYDYNAYVRKTQAISAFKRLNGDAPSDVGSPPAFTIDTVYWDHLTSQIKMDFTNSIGAAWPFKIAFSNQQLMTA